MKKNVITLVSITLACLFLVSLVGCSRRVSKITDVKSFSDMHRQADKIDVQINIGLKEVFNFSITEKNEIEEVMQVLFSATLSNKIDPLFAATDYFPYITIYQGEKTYSLCARYIEENGQPYYFLSSNLVDKLIELATARGFNRVE